MPYVCRQLCSAELWILNPTAWLPTTCCCSGASGPPAADACSAKQTDHEHAGTLRHWSQSSPAASVLKGTVFQEHVSQATSQSVITTTCPKFIWQAGRVSPLLGLLPSCCCHAAVWRSLKRSCGRHTQRQAAQQQACGHPELMPSMPAGGVSLLHAAV